MSNIDFTSRGVEAFRRAAAFDNNAQYEAAYKTYIECAEIFMTALQFQPNHTPKAEILQDKLHEILQRAEKIKNHLHPPVPSSPPSSSLPPKIISTTPTRPQAVRNHLNSVPSKPSPRPHHNPSKPSRADPNNAEDREKGKLASSLESSILRSRPTVSWDDIVGLEGAKEALREAVVLPLRFPQFFTGARKPWRAILLYGPPGTGKSYLAQAVAKECSGAFFSISSADLTSKWLGESEKLVRQLFEMAREASRENDGKLSVIFIDEIDSLCGARGEGESEATRRMKTEFLVQMQGVGETNHQEGEENEEKTSHPHVLVLAATNLPWALDNAVRRRFERRVYIPLPDASSRAQMIRTHLGTTPHSLHETELTDLSTRLSFYSGSDINVLVRNAMMESIRHAQKATHFKKVSGPHPRVPTLQCEDLLTPCRVGEEAMGVPMRLSEVPDPTKVVPPKVSWGDFVQSLRTARPSVCEADVHRHLEFTQKFGQEG